MNVVTLVFGLILILGGFVTLVRKVHDRSIQETLALAHGDTASAVSAFAGVVAPIVSSIAGGIAFLAIAVLSR